ncbi:MAG: DUF4446 family protein [Clostridia bacterium]|nr:DUF4446 family protein [Clostridia bacterium]
MESILNFMKTDLFLIIILLGIILLLLLYITNSMKLSKLRKSYKQFMKKLGKGEQIDEILKKYIDTVEKVEENQEEIKDYCNKLDENMNTCIQKIGLVRYSAFKDTGSDLSFTLAILDKYNDGIVLNGIYSREMSNIYAKPVKDGKSTYTLSEEEIEAIQKAISK